MFFFHHHPVKPNPSRALAQSATCMTNVASPQPQLESVCAGAPCPELVHRPSSQPHTPGAPNTAHAVISGICMHMACRVAAAKLFPQHNTLLLLRHGASCRPQHSKGAPVSASNMLQVRMASLTRIHPCAPSSATWQLARHARDASRSLVCHSSHCTASFAHARAHAHVGPAKRLHAVTAGEAAKRSS